MKITKNVIVALILILSLGAIYTISSTINLKSKKVNAFNNAQIVDDSVVYKP